MWYLRVASPFVGSVQSFLKHTMAPSSSFGSLTADLSIECSDQPLDLCFHPTRPSLLAAALVDGTVEVHDYAELLEALESANAVPSSGERIRDGGDEGDGDAPDSIVSSTHLYSRSHSKSTSASSVPSARCVEFSSDGRRLYSGGMAGDLVGVDADRVTTFASSSYNDRNGTGSPSGVVLWRIPAASYDGSPLQLVSELTPLDPNILVSGDEAGGVRIWDVRLLDADGGEGGASTTTSPSSSRFQRPRGCVLGWKQHDDYISGVDCSTESGNGKTLLVCSADCTLSVYDLRQAPYLQHDVTNPGPRGSGSSGGGFVRRSDDQEDELLSIKVIKSGRKVVCGTGEGVLAVWSYGTWGDVSDRFPGHPASVDALIKVDEDTLLTGSSDGLIRVVSVHPNKLLGILGDHDGFPIEKLGMSSDASYVGSVTHDPIIRLFDARILQDDPDGRLQGGMEMDGSRHDSDGSRGGSEGEWEDMEEDSDDAVGSNSRGGTTSNDRRAGRLKSENERFFQDL
jgi:WD40 repeat protein